MLRTQEVELVVPLLLLHELREELAAVTRHELSRQLHHIQVEGGDRGRIGHELELGWRLLGNHRLVDDLRLHLEEAQHPQGLIHILLILSSLLSERCESDLLRELLLRLLHGLLLHDLRHGGRRLLTFALFELVDLVAVVGMVRVGGVQEIKLGVVDLVLTDPRFKLGPVPVRSDSVITCETFPPNNMCARRCVDWDTVITPRLFLFCLFFTNIKLLHELIHVFCNLGSLVRGSILHNLTRTTHTECECALC